MSGRAGAPSSAASRCSSRRVHLWCAWVAAAPLLLSAVTGCAYRVLRSAGAEKESVRWLMELHTLKLLGGVALRAWYPLILMLCVSVMVLTGIPMTALWAWLRSLLCARRRGASADSRLSRAVELYERQQSRKLLGGGGGGGGAESNGGLATGDSGVASGVGNAEEESEWSEAESDSIGLQGLGLSSNGSSSVLNRYVPPTLTPRWTLWQRLQACFPARFTWRWLHRAAGTVVFVPLLITAVTGGLWVFCTDWLYWEKSEYRLLMYLHEGRYLEQSGTLYVSLLGPLTAALVLAGMSMLAQRGCSSGSNAHWSASPSSLAYSRVRSSAATEGSGGAASFSSPPAGDTRKTLARIQQAFDLDDGGLSTDQSEDEFGAPGGSKQASRAI